MNKPICNVPNCNSIATALKMCNLHYQRQHYGKPLIQPEKPVHTECTVADCNLPPRSRYATMCPKHYHRLYRYGTLERTTDLVKRGERAPSNPYTDISGKRFGTLVAKERVDHRWLCLCDCGRSRVIDIGNLNRYGDSNTCGHKATHYRNAETYSAAHGRVRQDFGSASNYSCVDCGSPALHWSYNHDDPDEMRDWSMKGAPWFSMSPKFYDARCVPCHKRFDLSVAKDRGLLHR